MPSSPLKGYLIISGPFPNLGLSFLDMPLKISGMFLRKGLCQFCFKDLHMCLNLADFPFSFWSLFNYSLLRESFHKIQILVIYYYLTNDPQKLWLYTTNIYLIVILGQEFGTRLSGWFGLRVSHSPAVRMLAGTALI